MASQDQTPARVLRVAPAERDPGTGLPDSERARDRFVVSTATSGGDALDRLDRQFVDCVVSDQDLPDMTGVEFLRRVRDEHPDTPFVLVTPTDDADLVREAFAAEATDCLPRAWLDRPEVVEHRIERCLADPAVTDPAPPESLAYSDFRLLVETVGEYAIFMLNPDGYVVSWNEGAKRIAGYERSEVLGQHVSIFYPHDAVESDTPERNLEVALEEGALEDEGWRVRKDGSQFWAHVSITPLYDDEDEFRGFAEIVRDMTERHERETELQRERTITDQFRVLVESVKDYAIFRLDTNGNVVSWNEGAERIKGYERNEILGRHFSAFYPRDAVEEGVPERNLEAATEEGRSEDEGWRVRKDGSQFWAHVTITALRDDDGDLRGYAKVTRDMTERRQYERELERQRDELAELEHVNSLTREISQTLVEATTREEIEQAVCTRLAADDAYGFAWIGSRDTGGDRVVPRSWSGPDDEPSDAFVVPLDDDAGGEMIAAASRTHTSQVVGNVRTDPGCEPWREAALDRGLQSAAAIPLAYGERTYGVLCVYAARPYAFDDREVVVLRELGELIGHAIRALETRKMLLAQRAVELELRIADARSVLARASGELGTEVRLEGVVPSTGGSALYYVTVLGAAPDAVRSFASDAPDVDDHRLIEDADERCLFELKASERSPILVLTERGGDVRTATADGGELRLVVDLTPDSAPRTVIDDVRLQFDDVDLLSKREVDRTVESERGFHAAFDDALTDRQRAVLEAASHAGYLEQPRESTGNDLADSLGITASTFHQHFRAAERKLVEAFLDG